MSERASTEHGEKEGRARTARRAAAGPRLDPNPRRPLAAADVLGLQRAIGNTAVTRLLGGGVVQRKSLAQTGWLSDLEAEKNPRTLVGDGREVNVYMDKQSTPAADKLEAFQKAAQLNAHVGKTVDDKAAAQWRITESNKKWTRGDRLNDDSLRNRVDPFFYEALVSFPQDDMTQYLGFMFQHAPSYTGYVEAILDTSNPGAQGVPSMYDKRTESGLAGTEDSDKGRNLKFSNVHDKTGSSNILTLTGGGGTEKNLDAYTKIAGEGSRWQAVRKHAASLQDDSLFYTRTGNPGTDKVWAVDFRQLWLSWLSAFDKKYDVTDATFRGKLAANADFRDGRQSVEVNTLGAKDYDLDNSRSHA